MIDSRVTARFATLASTYSQYTPLLITGIALLTLSAAPVMAQSAPGAGAATTASSPTLLQTEVGSVYCDTGVEDGIDLGFGAIAGLGLPLTGVYLVIVGIKYLKASTEKQKKEAKNSLTTAAIGFAILVGALLSPELIDKVGSEVGFAFSECVKPF